MERKANNSSPSCTDVKNAWKYTCISPYALSRIDAYSFYRCLPDLYHFVLYRPSCRATLCSYSGRFWINIYTKTLFRLEQVFRRVVVPAFSGSLLAWRWRQVFLWYIPIRLHGGITREIGMWMYILVLCGKRPYFTPIWTMLYHHIDHVARPYGPCCTTVYTMLHDHLDHVARPCRLYCIPV